MIHPNKISLTLTAVAVLSMVAVTAYAQESQQQDNTGTNPVNFTRDIRVYNEYAILNTEGDGTQNLTTAELRLPFADGKWQWRIRARWNSIKADLNDDGSDDLDDSGLGDLDMRFLTVLKLDMETRTAWAGGLEIFLNTADEDALGAGDTWRSGLQPSTLPIRKKWCQHRSEQLSTTNFIDRSLNS